MACDDRLLVMNVSEEGGGRREEREEGDGEGRGMLGDSRNIEAFGNGR